MIPALTPLPMEAAQKFWKDKVMLSPGQYAKLSEEAKLKAFAVSGMARGDELSTVFTSLQRALDDGIPFADFRKDCEKIFERRGWTGKAAWRVDNIFRTNIQTAYNVGRYKEMQAVKKTRPFWQYSAVNDSRTRPAHLAMNGRVFPADHPVWDTWYPPNGFRCRCGVVTLSRREVERDGLLVETDDPTHSLVEPVDPDTGKRLPARTLMPDPGFAYHPGKTVWDGVVDSAVKPGIWRDMPDLPGPPDYRRRSLANVRPDDIADFDAGMLLPAGQTDDFYQREFISRYGEEKGVTDAAGEPVILSLRALMADKAAKTWKFNKPGHGESIGIIEDLLTEPYEIWLLPQKNAGGGIRLTRRYVGFWKTEDKKRIGGLAVFESSGGVWQGVTQFLPKRREDWDLRYVEKHRRGILLWPKK